MEKVQAMLTVDVSLLFGLVAFAALAQIRLSVGQGLRRHQAILAELSAGQRIVRRKPVRAGSLAAA